VAAPTLRGLLGIEVAEGGRELRFAPQLPANWTSVAVRNVRAGTSAFDFTLRRTDRRTVVNVTWRETEIAPNGGRRRPPRLLLAPSFPLDADIRKVTVNGRGTDFDVEELGDRQFVEVEVKDVAASNEIVFTYDEGTDVFLERDQPQPGASNQGLRILRSMADEDSLHLMLEGLSGHTYSLKALSPRHLLETSGVRVLSTNTREPQQLTVSFENSAGGYVRREFVIPLKP
jgi:hypothetical protein